MSTSLSHNGSSLVQSEVREVLKYVPLFQNKTFIIVIDHSLQMRDQVLAELLLDLISLQHIQVKLLIIYTGQDQDRLLDWAAEVELKLSETSFSSAPEVINRGQAALILGVGLSQIGEEIKVLKRKGNPVDKVLYISGQLDLISYWSGALHYDKARSALPDKKESSIGHALLEIVQSGIHRVHILDGKMPGCLTLELFSNEGVGIMIYTDSYQEIRPLSEEDIPELLATIGRPVRSHHLLPRSYEDIESHLDDYYVMTFDGNVVGSVALHSYEKSVCELACLFVKGSHKGLGYGYELVKFAEERAKELKFQAIFALSTEAGGFFIDQLHYKHIPVTLLPQVRQDKLRESGRESIALMKNL